MSKNSKLKKEAAKQQMQAQKENQTTATEPNIVENNTKSTEDNLKREYLGTIGFYKQKLGYGFIKLNKVEGIKDQPDIFIHYSDVPEDVKPLLKPEQKVEFDIGLYDHPTKGESLKAINIKVI